MGELNDLGHFVMFAVKYYLLEIVAVAVRLLASLDVLGNATAVLRNEPQDETRTPRAAAMGAAVVGGPLTAELAAGGGPLAAAAGESLEEPSDRDTLTEGLPPGLRRLDATPGAARHPYAPAVKAAAATRTFFWPPAPASFLCSLATLSPLPLAPLERPQP